VVARRNIADGRSALDGDRWRGAGWRYRALGRPDTHSSADRFSLSG
jgi:UDPglucose 6-dehydrogenase